MLTVASDSGRVYNFLACLPHLAVAHGAKYMYLTSLLELSVRHNNSTTTTTPSQQHNNTAIWTVSCHV